MRKSVVVPNAHFDGGFYNYQGKGELTVAQSWTPWWKEAPGQPGVLHRPEYKPETMRFPHGQKMFTTFSTHQGGIYQQLLVLPDEKDFELYIDCQYLSKHTDGSGGGLGMRCGLDPTGGTDPYSGAISWGSWMGQDQGWDGERTAIIFAGLDAVVDGQITIWLESRCRFPAKHNDAYFDNVALWANVDEDPGPGPGPEPDDDLIEVLAEIRDVLGEIRDKL